MSDTGERDDVFLRPNLWSHQLYGDRCFYYDVFVSHSNDDESAELVEALRRYDLRVWYDKYQKMDDALWSTRITWGLHAARSLLCFVGSQPLEEHEWVYAEIRAGRAAGEAAGIQRVFIALVSTEEDVPSWLTDDPIVLRYQVGDLKDKMVEMLAAQLRNLNRVTINTSSPPFHELMKRAQAVRRLRQYQPPKVGSEHATSLDILQEYTATALEFVAMAKSLEDIDVFNIVKEANVSHVVDALYHMRVASDHLWPPPEQPVNGADGVAAGTLADDLGLLACLPKMYIDSRGAVYVVLIRVAEAGVEHAFEVLRSCLRWEWAEALIVQVADALARHPKYWQRDEAVLTLLKSRTFHDSWPIDLLQNDDKVVLLKHYARRLTAPQIARLALVKRFQELTKRMDLAIRDSDVYKVEDLLLYAIDASGIVNRGSNFFQIDANASSEAPKVLPALVLQCTCHWPPGDRIRLWKVEFETHVFGPLEALHQAYGSQYGASDAIAAYISALEAPVSEHEALLANIPQSARTYLEVDLALGELWIRRCTIRALRNGARIKRDGDELDIEIYPEENQIAYDKWRKKSSLLKSILSDHPEWLDHTTEAKQSGDFESILDMARNVITAWKDIPYC